MDNIQTAIDYIESHLFDDITVEHIAKASALPLSTLYRRFSIYTGMSVMSYLCLRRMAKGLVWLGSGQKTILETAISLGYDSQEAFTRSFKKHFGVSPGVFIKSGAVYPVASRKLLLDDFIHRSAHEARLEGPIGPMDVEVFKIYKPAHIWVALVDRTLSENFYDKCESEGLMDVVDNLPGNMRNGGGYMVDSQSRPVLSFYGKELSIDYEGDLPSICEKFTFEGSEYVVFRCPPYAPHLHGSAVDATYRAMAQFEPEKCGYCWGKSTLPIYNDDDENGFILMRAITRC
ncbi:transposon Tn10 TetD protein [Clostridium tepidiprofundi DSM 19306]|uniref:Transposon Tn10 TetD protein n=1 Tax=Clostridium tepidiprofundi DSM 19306 TaxID=1121338 RepID=A0A151ASB0_9CLOT|nr:AraC family transcriptional regulator [Clostridium tepidiprofundi]KYH30470.1 transposon Tn10 TetD protein [Clostridium tepidiprofundi DSM 19306]